MRRTVVEAVISTLEGNYTGTVTLSTEVSLCTIDTKETLGKILLLIVTRVDVTIFSTTSILTRPILVTTNTWVQLTSVVSIHLVDEPRKCEEEDEDEKKEDE